jgi:hypothetical protein
MSDATTPKKKLVISKSTIKSLQLRTGLMTGIDSIRVPDTNPHPTPVLPK